MTTTLEDAVPILEKWLKENIENALTTKTVLFHFSPKEAQEELGLSLSTFWYAFYRLHENGILCYNQPQLMSVFNTFGGQYE